MPSLLLVMLGGAVGAGGRYLAGVALLARYGPGLPYGTLAVNLLGGLAMGLLVGVMARFGGSEGARLLLGTGLIGGFTTFSAFSLDVVTLAQRGATVAALGYVAVSVAGSVAALFAGLSLVRAVA